MITSKKEGGGTPSLVIEVPFKVTKIKKDKKTIGTFK